MSQLMAVFLVHEMIMDRAVGTFLNLQEHDR